MPPYVRALQFTRLFLLHNPLLDTHCVLCVLHSILNPSAFVSLILLPMPNMRMLTSLHFPKLPLIRDDIIPETN